MDAVSFDYEHKITNKILSNTENPQFPAFEDYHLTRERLDGYLFDKQAILDSEGSKKSQYTVMGILIVLPIIVLSAFPESSLPWGTWSLFVGIAIGVVLAIITKMLMKLVIKARLQRIRDDDVERYIEAVLNY